VAVVLKKIKDTVISLGLGLVRWSQKNNKYVTKYSDRNGSQIIVEKKTMHSYSNTVKIMGCNPPIREFVHTRFAETNTKAKKQQLHNTQCTTIKLWHKMATHKVSANNKTKMPHNNCLRL